MDVSTANNQASAISNYIAQQQQPLERTRKQDQASASTVNPTQASSAQNQRQTRGDQVSFTHEALQLSAQSQTAANAPQAPAQNAATNNAYPLASVEQQQATQTASAHTVAQAINTYHNTFKI